MKATYKSYLVGFIISIALTLAAFFIVLRPGFFHAGAGAVVPIILVLAVAQLLVQLLCFLHIGNESGPRWKLVAFLSTASIVLIVIIGSIWIMSHLNYNMMASPGDMSSYIQSQDGL